MKRFEIYLMEGKIGFDNIDRVRAIAVGRAKKIASLKRGKAAIDKRSDFMWRQQLSKNPGTAAVAKVHSARLARRTQNYNNNIRAQLVKQDRFDRRLTSGRLNEPNDQFGSVKAVGHRRAAYKAVRRNSLIAKGRRKPID